MNELISFLTSKEIMIFYIVAGLACVLCFIIYLVEKNTDKRKRRSNTRELNKLVKQIQEEIGEEEVVNYSDEPVLETVTEVVPQADNVVVVPDRVDIKEETKPKEELEYTTIEPDQATAKLELQKLREELEKAQQEETVADVSEPEIINSYETDQEENAIISLEELVKKSKELYASNEKTQYIDDNTVPISLEELEKQVGKKAENYGANAFAISDVVSDDDMNENQVEMTEPVVTTNKVAVDGVSSAKINTSVEAKPFKFKSSPIISPIYGIENKEKDNDLALENTANYDKLDQEIKKTNEFLMTLRELQKKLD